jgi:hypothetical protein
MTGQTDNRMSVRMARYAKSPISACGPIASGYSSTGEMTNIPQHKLLAGADDE